MFRISLEDSQQKDISTSNPKLHDKHFAAIRPYIKERKNSNSKRDTKKHMSPHPLKAKAKKSENHSKRVEESGNSKQLSDIYAELISLKAQYKGLKSAYNELIKEKNQISVRSAVESEAMLKELERTKKDLEKSKKNTAFMEEEMERIRKECFKLLETEKFKTKKLEQTIEEKELMIAYLRSQLANNQPIPDSSLQSMFLQQTAPAFNYDHISRLSINQSSITNIPPQIDFPRQIERQSGQNNRLKSFNEEDSLSFSRDKSKEFESIQSVNEPIVLSFTKKDIIVIDEEVENERRGRMEESLPTFEDRSILPENVDPNSLRRSENKYKLKNKGLHIYVDESSQQEKGVSVEVRKKKNRKKQSNKRRKSEEMSHGHRKKQ